MKRGRKDDIILYALAGLAVYFLANSQEEKASSQNENLTTKPTQNPSTIPQRQTQTQATSNKRDFIIKVQRFLNANGYRVTINGVWNAQTNTAQLAYMKKRGIKTSATFRKLVESWTPKTR